MRDIAVKIAMKLGIYHWLVKQLTKWNERKMRKVMKRYGFETLCRADEAVRSFGGRLFLDFGTLLGAYREKNFIAHDADLDVGLLANERPENMAALMAQFGFRHTRQFYNKETQFVTEDQFEYKGMQIDFFYYFDYSETHIGCYAARRHETKEWKEANATDGFPCVIWPSVKTSFTEKDFLGRKFFMPDAAATWLEDVYGEDFMTPVKAWTDKGRKTTIVKSNDRLYRRVNLS